MTPNQDDNILLAWCVACGNDAKGTPEQIRHWGSMHEHGNHDYNLPPVKWVEPLGGQPRGKTRRVTSSRHHQAALPHVNKKEVD